MTVKRKPIKRRRMRWHAVIDRIPVDRAIRGVEVGVWRGATSSELLKARELLRLELVDPYRKGDPDSPWYLSGSKMPAYDQKLYDDAYALAQKATAFAADRATFHLSSGVAAAQSFTDHSFHFVFVDGDHSYEGAVEDLVAWTSKVEVCGWIGGHDYDKPHVGQVTEAVRDCFPGAEIETDSDSTWFLRVAPDLQVVDPRTP